MSNLKPELLNIFQNEGYSFNTFYKDLVAGLVVGILAVPMSIAFAVAAGARPEQGLYTAFIAGLLASLFGGSRWQISGPTGAFVVIIYDIINRYGYDGLVVATLMGGIILIIMGISKCGLAIKFIPYPVIVGFTSGIALLIFTAQLKDFLGLNIAGLPPLFVDKWVVYGKNIFSLNSYHLLIGILSIAITVLWPRYVTPKVPGALMAIIAGTIAVSYFHLPVETLYDRFGQMPCCTPTFSMPNLSWTQVSELVSPAISIALLAGIESLLSAIVADGVTGRKHHSNIELVGQGIANLGSALGGGIPATGAVARTITNINNGGQTPMAGIFQACIVLVLMISFANEVGMIPFPVLAGIMIVIAYRMSEWRHFKELFHAPKSDVVVMLTTFFLTLFVDLVVAIQAGVIIAAFLFINRIAESSNVHDLRQALDENQEEEMLALSSLVVPEEVDVFDIHGSFFFAAAEKFKSALIRTSRRPKILIIRMRHVLTIDATGIQVMKQIHSECNRLGIILLLSGLQPHIKAALSKAHFMESMAEGNICTNISKAIERANLLLKPARTT